MKLNKKLGLMFLLALAVGFWSGRRSIERVAPPVEAAAQQDADVWTCSMHPQIRQPEPGDCPICAMELIPVSGGPDREDPAAGSRLTLSEHARRLAEVETVPVERRRVVMPLTLSGNIAVDESLRSTVAARMPGRLDRLYVNVTGMMVRQGDPMAEIYSPALLSAQEELIQAHAFVAAQRRGQDEVGAQRTLEAARDKLRLLGLHDRQLTEIEERGTPSDHITLYAPAGGIVLERPVDEGRYVTEGSVIVELADLSSVWLVLEAYENDLPFLRLGQPVRFRVVAYPGRLFEGVISFIDPLVNDRTRVIDVRVQVQNEDGLLKPGMLARATVAAAVSQTDEMPPLVIPASAALLTGQRAVVYVESEPGAYEARTVELGPRAGDVLLVLSGLEEGERVVRRGAFKIDSEIQIQGRPSMMNPAGGSPASSAHGQHEMLPGMANGKSPQTTCPIMGGAINPGVYIDFNGYRVYFCCAGCDDTFLEDPEKYIREMKAAGVELEKTPTK